MVIIFRYIVRFIDLDKFCVKLECSGYCIMIFCRDFLYKYFFFYS